MSTPAQCAANQANAQHSTGPRTAAGKAAVARNNLRHGLSGAFSVLDWESQGDFNALELELREEHQPATPTENLLVEKMAQSFWLRRRALTLQQMCFHTEHPACEQPKELAVYIRYQTTHDRAFHKALNELLKLRAEKRKVEIGFESQKRKDTVETRRQDAENRKREMHQVRVWLVEAQTRRHETEIAIRNAFAKPPRAA